MQCYGEYGNENCKHGKCIDVDACRFYWLRKTASRDNTINQLKELSAEQRLEIFGAFCKYCGNEDPGCQCWNDE